MEIKSIKKSTMEQLKVLVDYMEENPEFARGAPVFGASKFSVDETWKTLCQNLNSIGPPIRSILEWKKTWADLKSRTKKKIATNKKSMQETGGGLYRMTHLTELEQSIDRTFLLSSAAAPEDREFGDDSKSSEPNSIEDCFQLIIETLPRSSKAVAVIMPTKMKTDSMSVLPKNFKNIGEAKVECSPRHKTAILSKRPSSNLPNGNGQQPSYSSTKKRKTMADEQLLTFRRQLQVSEGSAETDKQQADALERLAKAAELHVDSVRRQADAADIQAQCMKSLLEVMQKMEKSLEKIIQKL